MRLRRWRFAFLIVWLAGCATPSNPHALWQIVHGRCVPDEQANGRPAPCAVVDLARGFALLKDLHGNEQYLLIPTARTAGIEDPLLLDPATPNYFAEAWSEMRLVQARLPHPVPPEDLSLAVNSAYGRSQDQLHIHMECIRPAVHDALAGVQASLTEGAWQALPTRLGGERYRAMRLDGDTLEASPFRLLAASVRDPANQMAHHTLVLVGARFPAPGFILLDDRTSLLGFDHASGELLQDHGCMIARHS